MGIGIGPGAGMYIGDGGRGPGIEMDGVREYEGTDTGATYEGPDGITSGGGATEKDVE